jgi:hypothetical protein
MREHVKQRMTNPFDVASHPKSLVNISTGFHAPTEIEVALTNAFDNGIKIVNGTLTEGNNADFYSPKSRSKLKTFTDLIKTSKLRCGSGEILNVCNIKWIGHSLLDMFPHKINMTFVSF